MARKLSIVSSAQAIAPAIGFAFSWVIAKFIGWRGGIGIMAMGGLLIVVMSYLFIDESRRGGSALFRPASLIAAYLTLLKTSGVMFSGLTSGLAVGMSFAMGGAMQILFGGVVGRAVIALGSADHFIIMAAGLLIMALCAVLSSFLAPNLR